MKNIRCWIFLALLFACFSSCPAWAWEAEVFSVHDADTITVIRAVTREKIKIRLYGIDSPELAGRGWKTQPFGRRARNFLRDILPWGERVLVADMGRDGYSRTLGIVSLPNGTVVQKKLLEAGFAWAIRKYCLDYGHWKELEKQAREAKRGLWQEKKPMPPWRWRRLKSR